MFNDTGDNHTYILNVNATFNLTMADLTLDQPVKHIEIKGLQPERDYMLRILAVNSIGASEFSEPVRGTTLKTELTAARLPHLELVQFNDMREAVCFELRPRQERPELEGLLIKIDVERAAEHFRSLAVNGSAEVVRSESRTTAR